MRLDETYGLSLAFTGLAPVPATVIEISASRPIEVADVRPLLRQTDWAADRTDDELRTMLSGTPVLVGAWAGDVLVGFARALSDGRFRALIEDVVVGRGHRGAGLGGRVVAALLAELSDVELVLLFTDDANARFYGRFGFGPHGHGCYSRTG